MKLIDLLVPEFNKSGGWPKSLDSAVRMKLPCGYWTRELNGTLFFTDKSSNHRIYKGEYEAALAASKQDEWSGDGLPTVGCECELFDCDEWNPVVIKFVGDKYVVTERTDLGYEVVYCLAERPDRFRPIRTEAERKRDDACKAMTDRIDMDNYLAGIIYDDIASGKIPGIRLE